MSTPDNPSAAQDDIAQAAARLVSLALQLGLVLTIETVPLQPLRMGNYDIKISVRQSHDYYRNNA